jgi:hypothetical protein
MCGRFAIHSRDSLDHASQCMAKNKVASVRRRHNRLSPAEGGRDAAFGGDVPMQRWAHFGDWRAPGVDGQSLP